MTKDYAFGACESSRKHGHNLPGRLSSLRQPAGSRLGSGSLSDGCRNPAPGGRD